VQTANINEIFYSLSGEGVSQGVPTIFVRFAGCSLRCGFSLGKKLWCDTGYALSDSSGNGFTVSEVLERIESFTKTPVQILLTGGEPLEGEKRNFCKELTKMIFQKRHNSNYAYTRIETNGKENILDLDYMVFSLDYKLPGSGMETFMSRENFHYLKQRKNPLDEIKFVVRDRIDFDRALEIIDEFSFNENIIFSPVYGELQSSELAEWIKEKTILGARLSLQLHKILWGEKRGV
jgi:7-carboxy-7-deazaguanine synthase